MNILRSIFHHTNYVSFEPIKLAAKLFNKVSHDGISMTAFQAQERALSFIWKYQSWQTFCTKRRFDGMHTHQWILFRRIVFGTAKISSQDSFQRTLHWLVLVAEGAINLDSTACPKYNVEINLAEGEEAHLENYSSVNWLSIHCCVANSGIVIPRLKENMARLDCLVIVEAPQT